MAEDIVNINQKNIKNKATFISKLVDSLELTLSGYARDKNGEKKYTGNVLAGTTVITKAVGLLNPFSDESNLITSKEKKVFYKQKHEINSTFNEVLLKEMGSRSKNYKEIMKMFKTTLQNIGDIILDSKAFMSSILTNPKEDLDEDKKDLFRD